MGAVAVGGYGGIRPAPASHPLSVCRVSRLLADARIVLGGPSAHRLLASLGKLMPTLRAARRAGERAGVLWQVGLSSEPPLAQL